MSKSYALVAYFNTPKELLHAAKVTKNTGFKKFDAYSPFPIHGMDDAMGLKASKLGIIAAIGSVCLGSFAMFFQYWTSAVDYPLVLSGKEYFSYQAFVPITFELSILGAALATILGMFAINKLGFLYHPIFSAKGIEVVTDDGFALVIEAADPTFDVDKTKAFMETLSPVRIEWVGEDQA